MENIAQSYKLMKLADLKPHPGNPRQGDVGAIHESIQANGFYGALLVQKSTGYVIAGNHRLAAAKASGAKSVPAIEIDCDDDRAKRIMLADNRTTDLATYSDDALLALLQEVAPLGLEGTGYDGDDLDDLIAGYSESLPEAPQTVGQATSMKDLASRYQDKATRALVIEMPLSQFMWAVEQLGMYRQDIGMESNSDAFLRLLGDAVGEAPPVA